MTTHIFVSHSKADRATCEELRQELKRQGFESFFIDYHPTDGIHPGRAWEPALYRALRRCDVVLAIDSATWRTSQWCFAELMLARSLGKTIFLLQSTDGLGKFDGAAQFARDSQCFVFGAGRDTTPLFDELRRLGVRRFKWNPNRPPYVGLLPLEAEDAGVYFGRERDVRAVMDLMERCVRYGDKKAITLVGPSGCGKSSLLRAGVLPSLRRHNDWTVIGPLLSPSLRELPASDIAVAPAGSKILVALDQLDESLSQPSESHAGLWRSVKDFLNAEGTGRLLLITLRADYLGILQARLGPLADVLETYVVGPLMREDYRSIITQPAEMAGATVEIQLSDELLSEATSIGAASAASGDTSGLTTDALPMLAVTLRRLWERGRQKQALTHADYAALGGFSSIIAQTADAVLAASRADAVGLLKSIFLGMVRVDRDGLVTRQPLPRASIGEAQWRLVKRFIDEGLLVEGRTPGCIEIAHEALIRKWPVLAGWVGESRDELVRVERFRVALERFLEQPEALLEGVGLAEAEGLVARKHVVAMSENASAFIHLSLQRRADAIAREHEREHALRVSESLRIATEARQVARHEPTTALLLAWEGVLCDRNELTEAVFRDAVGRLPAPMMVIDRDCDAGGYLGPNMFAVNLNWDRVATYRGDGAALGQAVFEAVGRGLGRQSFAAASVPHRSALLVARAGELEYLDLAGHALGKLSLPGWNVDEPADCRLLVDGSVGLCQRRERAWLFSLDESTTSPTLIADVSLTEDIDTFRDERHSPLSHIHEVDLDFRSGCFLSVSTGEICMWNLDGSPRARFQRSEGGSLSSAKFIGNGRIASGSMQGEGLVLSSDGELVRVFRQKARLDLFIRAVDPRQEYFVTASNGEQHELDVWNADGNHQVTLAASGQHYWSAAFSPDGRWVAGGCADAAVRLWDWREKKLELELHGHTSTVHQVAFAPMPSEPVLLSSSHDRTLRRWTLSAPILKDLVAHSEPLRRMSRYGERVVTEASKDARTVVWKDNQVVSVHGRVISPGTRTNFSGVLLTQEGDEFLVTDLRGDATLSDPLVIPGVGVRREGVLAACVSPDRLRAAVSFDAADPRAAALWFADGRPPVAVVGPNLPRVNDPNLLKVCAMGFNPQTGALVTGADNGMLWFWDDAGQLRHSALVDVGSPDALLSMTLDPLGRFILVGIRNEAVLLNWSGLTMRSLRTRGYKVHSVSVSPGSNWLITVSDNPSGSGDFAELWFSTGHNIALLDRGRGGVTEVRFDPAERYFAIRGQDLRIFDLEGQLIGVLAGDRGVSLESYDFSPHGDLIAAHFSDGVVRVWSFKEQRRSMSISTEASGPIAFTPDGRRLWIATEKGAIQQHALDIADLFPGAAQRLERGLNSDEMRRFAVPAPLRLNLDAYRMPG